VVIVVVVIVIVCHEGVPDCLWVQYSTPGKS
jgi:hypothetical protein